MNRNIVIQKFKMDIDYGITLKQKSFENQKEIDKKAVEKQFKIG